ncbi:DUF5615 family PIN-like protein [Brevundimonas bacteroides]|uniref:DUF5615 family PIN-like protein n=1 Tax=Brevundimonas bacteroides TaxID=74311 RepID=UPI0012ED1313|nr:DUF5615 family PIN-like protein [Brevundimonas bacteroides]
MLDENVPEGVADTLRRLGHDVIRSTEVVVPASPDQIVATAAQEGGWILVSHDRDFKRIERLCSEGQQERFPTLSRLQLSCPEPLSASRVEMFISIVEAEFERVQQMEDRRLMMDIGERRIRIFR